MYTVHIFSVYINTNTCIYLRKICYVHMLNIFMYNIKYKNMNIYKCINVNIFKIDTVCVCIYVYIINIYSKHTYIM